MREYLTSLRARFRRWLTRFLVWLDSPRRFELVVLRVDGHKHPVRLPNVARVDYIIGEGEKPTHVVLTGYFGERHHYRLDTVRSLRFMRDVPRKQQIIPRRVVGL